MRLKLNRELLQGLEAIGPPAGTITAGMAGYSVVADITKDGKLALVGLPLGALAFAALLTILLAVFRTGYRVAGGSPTVVLASSYLTAALVLGLLFLHP